MESVSNRRRVVGCEGNVVGSNVYLVYYVSDERIDLFEGSYFTLEVGVVTGDVWGFDVYDDEVLVLGSLDYSLRLSLIICLNATSRSSYVITSMPAALAMPLIRAVPEMQAPRRSNIDLKLGKDGRVPAPLVNTMLAGFSPSFARS